MKRLLSVLTVLSAAFLCACSPELNTENPPDDNPGDVTDTPGGNDPSGPSSDGGLEYLYDGKNLPEFHLSVSLDEWNRLLAEYDKDNDTSEHIHADLEFVKGEERVRISDIGVRLKGNTSRRRPEGNGGEQHTAGSTDWHHCHYQLNFTKYKKGDSQELHGVKKVYLKWFKDDPTYSREVFCYDLFRRFGVWTAPHSAYCRLWLYVEGDPKPVYLGVYGMVEPPDGRFVRARESGFADKDGFLWKCSWGASLGSTDEGLFGNDGSDKAYELKTETDDYELAKAQLQDFILKVKGKGDESFYNWIKEVCDVELLLRTYAVNVAVGMWDDYWKNKNNYYLYFNSKDKYAYKFFFIPYDYDNTLGTSSLGMDSGRQDPLNWGDNGNPLIYKLLRHEEFRKIYKQALLSLVEPDKGEMYYTNSMSRIRSWHSMIKDYVSNDTGEDMTIRDETAEWSNHKEYRLLEEGNNFFKVKAESINKYCK